MCAQAFYSSLVDDLKLSPPCFVRVLRLFREYRDGFSEVSGGREASAIREIIDIEFIETQLLSNSFGWDSCKNLVSSVVTIVKRIQAPARDVAMNAKWTVINAAMANCLVDDQPQIFVNALRFLLDCLSFTRVDAANAR
jgi:hypothetical protein